MGKEQLTTPPRPSIAPAGALSPLVPCRPWISCPWCLLESRSHTVTQAFMDHFSKSAHFVPLPKRRSVSDLEKNGTASLYPLLPPPLPFPRSDVRLGSPVLQCVMEGVVLPHRASTYKPTGRRRGSIKSWISLSAAWWKGHLAPERTPCSGWSMPTIACWCPRWGALHSPAAWATSHPSSSKRRRS